VISHSYNVYLNPFELRWVCEVKAYSPIRFEEILSTFNFDQNLIPWISAGINQLIKRGGFLTT
jgi:hypothetical protein